MSDTTVKTFDPKNVIIVFGGVPLTGYSPNTFISVAAAGDRFSKVVGADGETARGKSNDYTHEVTLTLMQTSLSNDYLSGIMALDKLSNSGILPLSVLDKSGSTLFFWDQAWVKKPPNWDGQKEVGERAWVFDTGQVIEENIGGNS